MEASEAISQTIEYVSPYLFIVELRNVLMCCKYIYDTKVRIPEAHIRGYLSQRERMDSNESVSIRTQLLWLNVMSRRWTDQCHSLSLITMPSFLEQSVDRWESFSKLLARSNYTNLSITNVELCGNSKYLQPGEELVYESVKTLTLRNVFLRNFINIDHHKEIFPKLTKLIMYDMNIYDSDFAFIMKGFCRSMADIKIANCPKLTVVAVLTDTLEHLSITHCILVKVLIYSRMPINHFNLKTLDVSYTALRDINLDLIVKHSPFLSSIVAIGVNSLKHLTIHSNSLKSVDFSLCRELLYLSVKSNNITSLKLLGCSKLVYLHINCSRLEALNLSNSSDLTCLHLFCTRLRVCSLENTTKLGKYFFTPSLGYFEKSDFKVNMVAELMNCTENSKSNRSSYSWPVSQQFYHIIDNCPIIPSTVGFSDLFISSALESEAREYIKTVSAGKTSRRSTI